MNFYKQDINSIMNTAIDNALTMEQSFQPTRDYIGGSRVGVECIRALQYETLKVPVDLGLEFSGRILRIFERGHWVESAMVRWLRLAGFGLLTEKKDGGQFGFDIYDGKAGGHCDGIFISGPDVMAPWPRLWECKGIAQKYFLTLKRNGLIDSQPVYWAQVQYYQKHFGLTKNPALFSAVNMNTMDIEWISVTHEPNFMEFLEHKLVIIFEACDQRRLLDRPWAQPIFKCKLCSYQDRCWK